MNRICCLILLAAVICGSTCLAQDRVGVWMKYEKPFESGKTYENPLYDVKEFAARFTSPSGRVKKIHGFWDGGRDWKVRFCPDEKGTWTFETSCSDAQNKGLHGVKGSFEYIANESKLDIYVKGGIVRPKGCYYLTQADECGTIVAYVPVRLTVKLYNPPGHEYVGQWFSSVANDIIDATLTHRDGIIEATPPRDSDMVLVLHRK